MRRVERRTGPPAMSILIGAVIGGFGLLATGIGWVKSDVQAVNPHLSTLESSLSERISSLAVTTSGRFTRIETLLEQPLPERR